MKVRKSSTALYREMCWGYLAVRVWIFHKCILCRLVERAIVSSYIFEHEAQLQALGFKSVQVHPVDGRVAPVER